jgi:hypothetical protein
VFTPQEPVRSGFGPYSTTAEVIAGIGLNGKTAVVSRRPPFGRPPVGAERTVPWPGTTRSRLIHRRRYRSGCLDGETMRGRTCRQHQREVTMPQF